MNPLIKMAWLNIWRNPRRAAILLAAMASGLVGILFCMSFIRGWLVQMVDDSTGTYEGHVKILARGFNENPVIENNFVLSAELAGFLDADLRVDGWVPRIVAPGLLCTPEHAKVVTIIGTDPAREIKVATACRMISEGRMIRPETRGELLVGRNLAAKINKSPGRKVILMSQQLGGEIGTAATRIAGIYDVGIGSFNEANVYLTLDDAAGMLNVTGRITEVAVRLRDINTCDDFAADLRSRFSDPAIEILTWRQRLPYVDETISLMGKYAWLYYAIFYTAMAFGIVNTLIMAIGERTHEIGVLLAVGMTRLRLIFLIVLESMFIAVVAVAAGLLMGTALVMWFNARGIDLSAFAEGMDLFGLAHVMRPVLDPLDVRNATAGTFIISILFSCWPAWRAASLVPVSALRQTG